MKPGSLLISVALLFFSGLLSCKKGTTNPVSSIKDHLTGNGTVKYWQAVAIVEITPNSGNNLYATQQACAVDNYLVFFDNGDFEERNFGQKCFADERFILNTFTWGLEGNKLKLKGMNGSSIYEISSTLFGSEVTVTESTSTRLKAYRTKSPGDTIKFTLSAVPSL